MTADQMFENNISRRLSGWLIPTVTGSISFFSSALIICIIVRSKSEEITATYHRIIFVISSADMIMSLAIALTTIPMPKDVNEVYHFDGKAYGTTRTCEIQAFSYLLGSQFSTLSNLALTMYFFFKIRFQASVWVMRAIFEPTCMIVSTAIVATSLWTSSQNKLLNPLPFSTWCTMGDYPYRCNEDDGVACIRGEKTVNNTHKMVIGLVIVQVIALLIILFTVIKTNRNMNNKRGSGEKSSGGRKSGELEHSRDAPMFYHSIRLFAIQAFAYFMAFIASTVFIPHVTLTQDSVILQVVTMIFKPLQGLFNATIFICDKVNTIQTADEGSSFVEAFGRLLRNPSVVPALAFDDPESLLYAGVIPSWRKREGNNNVDDGDDGNDGNDGDVFDSDIDVSNNGVKSTNRFSNESKPELESENVTRNNYETEAEMGGGRRYYRPRIENQNEVLSSNASLRDSLGSEVSEEGDEEGDRQIYYQQNELRRAEQRTNGSSSGFTGSFFSRDSSTVSNGDIRSRDMSYSTNSYGQRYKKGQWENDTEL